MGEGDPKQTWEKWVQMARGGVGCDERTSKAPSTFASQISSAGLKKTLLLFLCLSLSLSQPLQEHTRLNSSQSRALFPLGDSAWVMHYVIQSLSSQFEMEGHATSLEASRRAEFKRPLLGWRVEVLPERHLKWICEMITIWSEN